MDTMELTELFTNLVKENTACTEQGAFSETSLKKDGHQREASIHEYNQLLSHLILLALATPSQYVH